MTYKKSTVFYLAQSSGGKKYKNSENSTNFWISKSPLVLALRESPSKGQCKTTLPEMMLQETPLSRIITPLYTAVPFIVKALSSIWPVQEASHLKRRNFTITCLVQAPFSLLKTKATVTADYSTHSIGNLQNTPSK